MPRQEIAPGLFVGSEMEDLRLKQKVLITQLVRCKDSTDMQPILKELERVQDRIRYLLLPKYMRGRQKKT